MLAFSFYHNIAFPCVGTPSPPSPTEYRTFLCSSLDSQFLSLEPDRLCGHPAEVCWVTGYAKNKRMEKARKRGKAKKGCNTDTRIFFLLLYYKRLPKIQLLIHEPYIWSFIGGKHRMMICVGKYPSRAYLVFTPHSEDRRPSETRCWMYSGFFGCLCVCVCYQLTLGLPEIQTTLCQARGEHGREGVLRRAGPSVAGRSPVCGPLKRRLWVCLPATKPGNPGQVTNPFCLRHLVYRIGLTWAWLPEVVVKWNERSPSKSLSTAQNTHFIILIGGISKGTLEAGLVGPGWKELSRYEQIGWDVAEGIWHSVAGRVCFLLFSVWIGF